jgi:hypothetical protein
MIVLGVRQLLLARAHGDRLARWTESTAVVPNDADVEIADPLGQRAPLARQALEDRLEGLHNRLELELKLFGNVRNVDDGEEFELVRFLQYGRSVVRSPGAGAGLAVQLRFLRGLWKQ